MMASTYRPPFAVHPGAHLDEKLDELGMSQAELARRTGLSQKHISQLISGEASLSPRTALLLERVTKMPASLWNNLESRWVTYQAALEESSHLEDHTDWASNFPIKEMKKRQLIDPTAKSGRLVGELLTFFGIGSIDSWDATYEKVAAAMYRTARSANRNSYAVATWLREAELQAGQIEVHPFEATRAKGLPAELREVTRHATHANEWWPQLVSRFAEAGIALVMVPEYPALTKLAGASRWLTPNKAMIALTGRGKRADMLWFTLLHELGHVILHQKKQTYINIEDGAADDPQESEADRFAAKSLIPGPIEAELNTVPSGSLQAAVQFAHRTGLHPSIVIGRLHHEQRLPPNYGIKKYFERLDLNDSYWTVANRTN